MRHLLKTTTLYSVAAMTGPVVALLLTPLYVASIGVAGYGTVDLLQTVIQLLIPIALWGVPTTLIARTTNASENTSLSSHVFAGAMALAILVSGVLCVLCLLSAPMIASTIQRPELSDLLRMYAVALPFASVYGVVLAIMRVCGYVWRAVTLMVAYVVILAVSRLLLVIWFDADVPGMIMALTLTNIVVALLGATLSWQWWWIRLDWAEVWQFVRLGAPLLPASIAVWLLLFIDRWFLVQYVTPLAQGQYALAALLASLMAFVAEPFKQAWQPIARHQSQSQFMAWSLTMYGAVALLAGAVVVTWTPEIVWLIGGADARAATPFVSWLVVAPLLSGVVAIVSMPAIRAQRTSLIAWATLAGAVTNIGLNIWLIPYYGAQGAAWATAVAALIIPLVHVWLHQSFARVDYDWVCLLGFVMLWGGYLLILPSIDTSVVLRIVALIALVISVGLLTKAWQWRQWAQLWRSSTHDLAQ